MISQTILITGTPGTGKTTVGENLAQKYGWKILSLSTLVLEKKMFTEIDKARDTKIVDDVKLKKYLDNYFVENQGSLIIEAHYADADFISHESIQLAIILRCHPHEIENRLAKRNYSDEKVRENIQSELVGTCANDMMQEKEELLSSGMMFEIDTTTKDVTEISQIIFSLIEREEEREKYKVGKISWLSDPSVNISKYL